MAALHKTRLGAVAMARLWLRKQKLLLQGRALTWLYEQGYIIKVKR